MSRTGIPDRTWLTHAASTHGWVWRSLLLVRHYLGSRPCSQHPANTTQEASATPILIQGQAVFQAPSSFYHHFSVVVLFFCIDSHGPVTSLNTVSTRFAILRIEPRIREARPALAQSVSVRQNFSKAVHLGLARMAQYTTHVLT